MDGPAPRRPDETDASRPRMNAQKLETWVDQAIQQAQRNGDFDDLPGAGKPLPGLDRPADPDWWVKGLIEREKLDLSAAMPGALALRRERATYPQALADVADEARVRERLEDFNERVLAERRRPVAGPTSPPVVGRVDVEEMVARWRDLRAGPVAAADAAKAAGTSAAESAEAGVRRQGRRRWWRRG